MANHIIVQARTPEDREDFPVLFIMSAPTYLPALLGANVDKLMRSLFRYKRTLFSFEHMRCVKVDGRNAGMYLGYDWRAKKKEDPKTAELLARYMKEEFTAQLPHLIWAGSVLCEIEDGTFYISNIAVYPEFRSSGLGTSLLLDAEEASRKLGAKSIALDVETDNEGGIRLYKRMGYDIIGEPKGTVINGEEFEFFRMCKDIS
ncbi:MAG: GNAT family N-acetyltransferase [Dehalococcoidia bacterium]|nr:GNAT family N-acetyltransferase [Chloroflexota bacterium]MCK4242829.1 GNAT family N-acetyltransferase [Dehalococcoidia bacterium]